MTDAVGPGMPTLAGRTLPAAPPAEPAPKPPLIQPEPKAVKELPGIQLSDEPPPSAAAIRQAPSPRGHGPSPAPKVARAGFALMMRTGDGEEAVNPFRSLKDLLFAAKPLLR